MIIIIPGTGKGKLILHISQPLPSPGYPHHQPIAITVPVGGKRVAVLHSLAEDYKFQIYSKDGQGGRSALATSLHLSLSLSLCREKEQADSKLKRQQGAQGKVTNVWLGQLGFLGIQVETLGYKMRGLQVGLGMWMEEPGGGRENCPTSFHRDPSRKKDLHSPAISGSCSLLLSQPQLLLRLFQIFLSPAGRGHRQRVCKEQRVGEITQDSVSRQGKRVLI